LTVDQAVPLGLVLNELLTNALVHAFPGRSGQISIDLGSEADGGIHLEVADDGVGFTPPTDMKSLGLELVKRLVRQLRARLVFDSTPTTGSRYRILVPREEQRHA
ncbi:MAG TPA: sensor histidine kinase, partial [Candidatus Xenobia bacterium]